MPLDIDLLGRASEPTPVAWDSTDALDVGVCQYDATEGLSFTTECSEGHDHVVLPAFAINLMQFHEPEISLGKVSHAARLHAEQSLTLKNPRQINGTMLVTRTVTIVQDKGSGALVAVESVAVDPGTGDWMAISTSKSSIKGARGFDGPESAPSNSVPSRAEDLKLSEQTQPNQPLPYRLSGDRNPLRVDPCVAAGGGFERPIFQGLCTYGIALRVLLTALCDGDSSRFGSISGRFTKPVFAGEKIEIAVWHEDTGAAFQVRNGAVTPVIDRGYFSYTKEDSL